MIDFLSIVLLIFGVLQIILFFKVWGMTNNVNKIKDKLEPQIEDKTIIEAQLKALDGKNEDAFSLYQKVFYINIIELYNKAIREYGDEELDTSRDSYYEQEYSSIMKYYSKRVQKLNMELNAESFDSFQKVNAIISKL